MMDGYDVMESSTGTLTLKNLRPVGSRKSKSISYQGGLSASGKPIKKLDFYEAFQCMNVDIELTKWLSLVKDAVVAEHKEELFNAIVDYCRKNHVWLRTQEEIEMHAAECLVRESYKKWEDFTLAS